MHTSSQKQKAFKILIVEDNEVCQKLFKKIFDKNHFKYDIVDNGLDAINSFSKRVYDLILMDYKIPVLDGFETTKKIRQIEGNLTRIPIIAISANATKEFIPKALEAGVDEYLFKPFDIDRLLDIIQRYEKATHFEIFAMEKELL